MRSSITAQAEFWNEPAVSVSWVMDKLVTVADKSRAVCPPLYSPGTQRTPETLGFRDGVISMQMSCGAKHA
jgi:hypothetical protein